MASSPASAGFEQVPVAGSQVPTVWHWSAAVQVTGLPPVQTPAWQVSVWVQALLSLHAVPSAALGVAQVPVAGVQAPAVGHSSAAPPAPPRAARAPPALQALASRRE